MAFLADNYDKTYTLWNPGRVYIGITPPAVGAIVTLDANGRPDTTENPTAKHIGMTRKGTKCSYKFTKVDAKSNELPAPHESRISAEQMMMAGNWLQVLDPDLLSSLSVGGSLATITGAKKLSFGGARAIATTCILVVSEKKNAAGKWVQFCIYAGYNEAGIELNIDGDAENETPFSFQGQIVIGRTVNDMIGYVSLPT